jgi:hypothetical protein
VNYIRLAELTMDQSRGKAAEEKMREGCDGTSTTWTAVISLGIP